MTPIRVNVAAIAVAAALWSAGTVAAAGMVRPEEMRQKDQWAKAHLLGPQAKLPFSFVYDGQPSDKLLASWPTKAETKRLDADRTQHTITWTEPKAGLEVRCVAVDYADFPACEWTVYFQNAGKANSPILKDVQGIDTTFQRAAAGEFVLHGNKGEWAVPQSYEPYRLALGPNVVRRFAPNGGRATDGPNGWPYYNVQWPGGGLMLAVGWPGQWASSFSRDGKNGLRIVAGQELTHLSLRPGEEVRTPLIAMLFWQGADELRAQNVWRRWFMAHNIPKIHGRPPAAMAQMQLAPALQGSEAEQWREARKFAAAGIDIDLFWNDAGWYPCGGDWTQVGTWEPDPKRFPKGFKPIAVWIHARGKKLIVWFEPERVAGGTWLAENHPAWVLGAKPAGYWLANHPDWFQGGRSGGLLNLGDPRARQWLTDHVDKLLTAQGIDYYRQDFNMDPLPHWRGNDAPDRQGITENLHVQGYLAFWDELRRRHPGMLIDSCASGGRRNDLETLRRAVPLLRSDFQPAKAWEAQHGHTYGISSWIPYYGSGVPSVEKYPARSFFMPCFGLGGSQDMKKAKAVYAECRKVAPLMLGDYYPLTPYSLQLDQWIAWQFDRPEQGDGVIQAFRRDKCAEAAKTFRLSGFDPAAQYELTNFDVEGTTLVPGKELMDKGLSVEIKDSPGAAVIVYRRAK